MEFLKNILDSIGGVETLVLIAGALVIAWYLHHLSKREKAERKVETLTAARLAETPDAELVNTVVRDLLDSCERARKKSNLPWTAPDMYRMVTEWANPQVNVYSVWVAVKETENGGIAALKASPSHVFFDLAADGFAAIGADGCAAALRDEDEAAFAAALTAEQPLARCAEYIRDNAEAFVKE